MVGLAGGVFVAFLLALVDAVLRLRWLSALARRVAFVLIPPLILIFLVLGTIFLGVATPTEGGALGAVGALVLAGARRRLTLRETGQALLSTTKLACFVMFVLIGATVFSFTFQAVDGSIWVEDLLGQLPGGATGFLIFVTVLVFLLGFFLDFFEIAFILLPLLGPIAAKLGIDLIWFGVLVGINLQTSFLTPPFGFALFYLRSVAPNEDHADAVTGKMTRRVTTADIYLGSLPFVAMQVLVMGLIIAFPVLVLGEAASKPKDNKAFIERELREMKAAPKSPDAAAGPDAAAAREHEAQPLRGSQAGGAEPARRRCGGAPPTAACPGCSSGSLRSAPVAARGSGPASRHPSPPSAAARRPRRRPGRRRGRCPAPPAPAR